MNCIIYDPEKQNAKYKDKSVVFYCGDELTEAATAILQLYFGIVSPQDALIDNIKRCYCCKKGKND